MRNRLETFYGELDECYLQGDLTAVERFLLECEKQARSKAHGRRDELIAVYNELGSFYRGVGRYAQSVAAFEKARALAMTDLGKDCSQYATILKATPQNTQKERPCGKIPPGRAYIRHSISAAAALI